MKNIKIIKRKTGDNELNESPAVEAKTPDSAKFRREAASVITGRINDLRERKQTDTRVVFNNLFKPFGV